MQSTTLCNAPNEGGSSLEIMLLPLNTMAESQRVPREYEALLQNQSRTRTSGATDPTLRRPASEEERKARLVSILDEAIALLDDDEEEEGQVDVTTPATPGR